MDWLVAVVVVASMVTAAALAGNGHPTQHAEVALAAQDAPLESVEFAFRQLTPAATYTVAMNGCEGQMTADAAGTGRYESP